MCLNSNTSVHWCAIHAELSSNIGEQCCWSFILTYCLCQCCTAAIRLITFANTVALHLCPDFGREGEMEEEGLEVYRSQAWSTSVRSRSLERRKGQRKGSLSLSQSIKREILPPLLQGISVICLLQCPTTLVCFVVSSFSLTIPCWSCLTGAVCCFFGLYQCVPMIHGTMHLFSSPLNVPSQRSARLHPQARTPAPSDLQLSCSFSNLQLFPLVFSYFFITHLHFLLPIFTQVSKVLFVILCFALFFQDFWIASVVFILLALNFTFQPVHSRRLSVLLTILKPSLSPASVGVPVKGILQ